MQKRLIIALDFSDYAQHLLKYAKNLISNIDADVVIVHESTVIAPSLTDADTRREIAKQTHAENLGKIKGLLGQVNFPRDRIKYEINDQNLTLILAKLLEEPYDHLILMGVKGTGTLKKIFLGSNVVSAIKDLDCKVLALPRNIHQPNPRQFLVGVNPKFNLNTDQLSSLLEFYQPTVKKLLFFSVLPVSEDTEQTKIYLDQLSLKFQPSYQTEAKLLIEGDVAGQTKALLEEYPNSQLVLQRGSRYFSDLVFRKMLINDLIYEGKVPLAVLP